MNTSSTIAVDALQWQQQQRLLDILSSLSYRTGELKPYLQAVASGVNQLIGLDWSVVTLCQNGRERILVSTLDLGEKSDLVLELHGTLTATVVQQGCPLAIEDFTLTSDCGRGPEGYRAYLGVPLRTPTGDIVGTICAFQHLPRCFTQEEIQLAEVFAERASTAIANYQLYQQQREFSKRLEAEVARQTEALRLAQVHLVEVNSLLEQRVQERTAELEGVNQQLQAEILERRQKETCLRESEERFRRLVEQAADAIFVHDLTGKIIDANQRACDSLGYTREELLTLSVPDIEAKLTADQMAELRRNTLPNAPLAVEGVHRRKDGTTFPVEIRANLFQVGERQFELAIVRDVTECKEAEKILQRLAEVGELASMIVHEVRNPLTTILMGLTSLQRLNLPEFALERLTLALEEGDRLRSLLNEILQYAKPQSINHVELELNHFIAELLTSICAMPAAVSHPINFIPAAHAIPVLGDRDKLKQVFINLVTNACEAAPEGEPITWTVVPQERQVCVNIHNGGDPIPPDLLPRLTQPFYTTKSSGTGLGLAIVQRIVEAHGGELAIASSAQDGTTVTLRLAIAAPSPVPGFAD